MNKKKNIIFIMTDQQKANSLGCYGNETISTPNIDELGFSGTIFQNAFTVSPLCVPSRCSVFTGRYPSSHGSRTNELLLSDRETTFLDVLKENGYSIGLSGKNHCFREDAKNRLFDFWYEAGHVGVYDTSISGDTLKAKQFQGQKELLRGTCATGINPVSPENCTTTLITDAAIKFIDIQVEEGPFFLWLSYPDPHSPYQVPEPYASMYERESIILPDYLENEFHNKPIRQKIASEMFGMEKVTDGEIKEVIATYYGMITFIDDQIGKLIQHLENLGIKEETIIVFTSDHGDYMGEHRLVRKSNALYDALIRIPLIFACSPDFGNNHSPQLIENIDIFPTVLDILGLNTPAGCQGKSYKYVLTGTNKNEEIRSFIFSEIGYAGDPVNHVNTEKKPIGPKDSSTTPWGAQVISWRGKAKMIRNHKYKLVYYPVEDGELYDVQNDPFELTNLYTNFQYDEIKNSLIEKLLKEIIIREDPLPIVPENNEFSFH